MAEPSSPAGPTVWLDYVDPASRLVEWRISRWEADAAGATAGEPPPARPEPAVRRVRRLPYEILPPGRAVLEPREPGWRAYLDRMREEARGLGVPLPTPSSVPWTRKAHELALQAREAGCFPAVHAALFREYWEGDADIGRVDVLVAIADAAGMDRTAVKAALDVDRLAGEVAALREEAERRGVRGVPTLRDGERVLEGYPPEGALESFLQA